jgi:hypothetical protein
LEPTTTGAPTTTTEAPTTTAGPTTTGGPTTTQAPACPETCIECEEYYYFDIDIWCDDFVEMHGTHGVHREPPFSSICEWYPGGDPFDPPDGVGGYGSIQCMGGIWILRVTHDDTGEECIYHKAASSHPPTTAGATTTGGATTTSGGTTAAPPAPDCPDGLYYLYSHSCSDCPSTITVYK